MRAACSDGAGEMSASGGALTTGHHLPRARASLVDSVMVVAILLPRCVPTSISAWSGGCGHWKWSGLVGEDGSQEAQTENPPRRSATGRTG